MYLIYTCFSFLSFLSYLCTDPSIYPSVYLTYLSTYPSIYLFLYLFSFPLLYCCSFLSLSAFMFLSTYLFIYHFFPTCLVRAVRFYVSSTPPSSSFLLPSSFLLLPPPSSLLPLPSSSFLFLPLPSSSFLPPPDLNCKLEIAVVPARPQLQAWDRSGSCRTRAESPGSDWSPPDPNSKPQIECQNMSDRMPTRMSE